MRNGKGPFASKMVFPNTSMFAPVACDHGQTMKTKAIMMSLVALAGLSALGSADAHVQVGDSSTGYCVSMPAPSQLNHVHVPGGATDDCTPPPPPGNGTIPWPFA